MSSKLLVLYVTSRSEVYLLFYDVLMLILRLIYITIGRFALRTLNTLETLVKSGLNVIETLHLMAVQL